MLSSRFKVLCADAGLSIDEAAKLLHVTPRTVRYWFSGKVTVPYAAYKLVRVLRWFELPGPAWRGWHFHSGKLWTPEGHGFEPHDANWWSLLVRQARSFRTIYERESAMRQALRAGRTDAPVRQAVAEGSPDGRGELVEPTGMAGGAAQPPRLIYLKNTTGHNTSNRASTIGETSKTIAWQIAHGIPHHEKQGVSV
ncbi:VC1465 family Xer recombination activation factor [Polaromonas sp. AER18D-145]|uniref:VC1465 family Xer recombination activation factor n=1 Tax=Polaromonas sp. AER18D-145 TaxID=1977060 RepID=UPI000BBCA4BF|nr:VC1465 family Xer recombination activation factor [Polaromonas sp. AER18D-145]